MFLESMSPFQALIPQPLLSSWEKGALIPLPKWGEGLKPCGHTRKG